MSPRGEILDALRAADGHVSGQDLATKLGITRAAVWKHIEALKRVGYDIEGVRSRGYRLVAAPSELGEAAVTEALTTRAIGRSLTWLDETGSTNSDALALGRDGAPHGTVVLADQQNAGRGRLGRTWESAPGLNLYLSILLRPEIVPALAPQLSLVAGVAAAKAVEEEGVDAAIKWPNDVIAPGGKVAGILTEIEAESDRVSFVVVGIGVNLNSQAQDFPAELREKASSVRLETGRETDRAAFAARLLGHFEASYEAFAGGGFAAVRPDWESRSSLSGCRVTISGAGEVVTGLCQGIDDSGALLLRPDDGTGSQTGREPLRRIVAGDVTIIGGYA